MASTDDAFLKAWESRQEDPSPTVPSDPPEDPWGSVQGDTGKVSTQGHPESTVNSKSGELTFDEVFQQCNNFTESAIPSKNNKSHDRDNRNSGFDDDFGEWSETDVLFKSGLLDQEFKTISVTAEEDDLWSSADLSSLDLSLQRQNFVPHGEAERQEEVASSRRMTFQNPDVIITSDVGNDDENINEIGVASSSKPKLSKEIVNQDFSETDCLPEVDPNLSDSFNTRLHNSLCSGEGEIGANTIVGLAHAVIHSNDIETTAGLPETVDTKGLRVTSPTETVKTSINSRRNTNASGDATGRSISHSVSSRNNSTSAQDNSNAHPRESIPSIVVNSASGTFPSETDKTKMGNILDSDKEEPEKMEGEVAVTEDMGGEIPPPKTGQVNGEDSTPSIDQKQTVVLHDEGTEVMVNGDGEEDGGSVHVSLDTETQTREDDFPPDEEYPAEPTTTDEAALKERSLEYGQLSSSPELIQKDIDIDEEKSSKEDDREDEKEDSSEGYGSQDADKALESEENGVEDHVKKDDGDTQKKQEVALSQDEGLSSPQMEENKVVSTNNFDQIAGGSLVDVSKVVDDGNVELVNVDDHAPPSQPPPPGHDEPTSLSFTSGTSSLGHPHSDDENTTQRTDTFEPYPKDIQITPTENPPSEQRTTKETNITYDNSDTDKTLVHSDNTYMSNVSRMEEEVDVSTQEITTASIDQTCVVSETQPGETNTAGEGTQNDSGVTQVESNQSSTEILKDSYYETEQEDSDKTERTVDLELPNENNGIMEENNESKIIVESGTPSTGDESEDTTIDVGVEMTSSPPSPLQMNGEETPVTQTKNEEESLKVTQLEEIPQDCENQQPEVSQECESKIKEEENQLLDLHEELDQNKFEEKVNVEVPVSSEDGEILEQQQQQQQLPEENISQFVDQVLSHAIEQVRASNSEDTLCKQEDVEIEESLSETAKIPVESLSVTEDIPEDSEMPEETNINSEKPVSTGDLDLSITLGMDQNCNFEPNNMRDEKESKVITNNVFVEQNQNSDLREAEQVDSTSEETRSHRWSVPAGHFTAGNFSLTDPESSGRKERKSESESTEMRKFRPVRFRPTSQMSKDARLRRTSLGVPRGWNAPPVDTLPLEPEVSTTKTEPPSFEPDESVTSSTPEDSTASSVSLHADVTDSTPKVQAVVGLNISEPSVQTSVIEQNLSARPPITDQTLADFDQKSSDSSDTPTKETTSQSDTVSPPMLPQNKSNASPDSEAVKMQVPVSPIQTPSQKMSTRNTPPLSQKVEVYQIMEGDPLLSPTGSDKRQGFLHARSATVGDQPNKSMKSEEERQQVFAALRVKRPMRHKWQGQVELEEKEREKQVILDEKSSQSLQKYEERRKHHSQSKSLDLGMGNRELSRAKPVTLSQGKNELGSQNIEREEPLTVHKNRPNLLDIEGSSEDYLTREEVLSPNGDTCSSGYTSGRSTPAGEDANRLLSLPKTGDYHNLVTLGEGQTLPCNEETGLRPVVLRDSDPTPEQDDQSGEGRPKSYVKTAVKMREKTSRVNSHVVRQNRISFVEQEVLRHKQQEEDFRREREMRSQELMQQGKSTSPSSLSPPSSTGNSRLQSPTSPEPPAAKSVKSPTKPTTSKAKAVYQELKYNPKTGGGNRSTAMVKEWESKFKK